MFRHQQDLVTHHLSLAKQLENFEVCKNTLDLMRDGHERSITQISQGTQYSIRQANKAVKLLKNMHVLIATSDLKHLTLHLAAQKVLTSGSDTTDVLEQFVTSEGELRQVHARGDATSTRGNFLGRGTCPVPIH